MIKGFAIALIGIITLSCVSLIETTYTMKAHVIDVKGTKVLAIDDTGEPWEFYTDEISVNDNIKLIFDDNHTNNRRDDVIKNYKIIK